jgi:hypothetical protein
MITYEYSGYSSGYGLKLGKIFKKATKFVTRAAPAAVGGFIVGGPAGAAIGAATGLIGGKDKPLKRLMYGLGAGSVLATATPALMKAFPQSGLVANIATSVYSSPIGSKLANLTYNVAFRNTTNIATQKALQQGNISDLPKEEKDKLASAMQLAAIAYHKGATEPQIEQILDTFFKTGDVKTALESAGLSAELSTEKPVKTGKPAISLASIALFGGMIAIPLLILAMRRR